MLEQQQQPNCQLLLSVTDVHVHGLEGGNAQQQHQEQSQRRKATTPTDCPPTLSVANNQQQQDQQSSSSKTAGQRKSRAREGRRGQQQQLQEEAQKASPSPAGAGAPADDGNDKDDETMKVPNSDRRRLSTSLPNFPLPRRPIKGEKGRKEEEEQQRKTIKNHQKLYQPEEGKEQRRQQGKVARITTGGGGGHHRDELSKMMGTFLGTVKLKETAVEFWRGTIGAAFYVKMTNSAHYHLPSSPSSASASSIKSSVHPSSVPFHHHHHNSLHHHRPHRSFLARQTSADIGAENGCCLVKALISNLLQFATRSRRKGTDLVGGGGKDVQRVGPSNNAGCGGGNGNGVCPVPDATISAATSSTSTPTNKKTGHISFSQIGSTKSARKAIQSVDTCVADSFDEQMIDKICSLPKNMDRSEWLASHVLALFEHVNGITCTLSETCTPATCPSMSYPGNQKVPWFDERGKRHNYSAVRYIDSVMSLCEASRTNQILFPTKYGASFSIDFEKHSGRMVRLLWHCLGHVYAKHWEHLGSLNLRPQFGLVLAHLLQLAKMYDLMEEKELNSLQNTLILARPSAATLNQQPTRHLKRGLDEAKETQILNASINPNSVQGRIHQAQQRKQQAQAATIQQHTGKEQKQTTAKTSTMAMAATMKSGSWSGHSAAVMAQTGAGGPGTLLTTTNCQPKCYAQTC